MPSEPIDRATGWFHRQASAYRHGEDRPLGGYVATMGIYAALTGAAATLIKVLRRAEPTRLSPWDVTQLALATHKASRLIAKDPVTSPLRAPFTEYSGTSAPGELEEEVRGQGWQHSTGEMLTCPMCLGQWVATTFTLGLALAPRPTRLAMGTFAGLAGADFLQHVYVLLQKTSE